MSEELLQKYRDLVLAISSFTVGTVAEAAKELLAQDFKEQVIELWSYDIEYRYDEYKEMTNIDFVAYHTGSNKQEEFVEKNWNRVSEIISIIKDEIERRRI